MKKIIVKEWDETPEYIPIYQGFPRELRKYFEFSDIRPRTDGNGFEVKLKAKQFVGIYPIEDTVIVVEPKIPLANFLYILSRATKYKVNIKEFQKIASVGVTDKERTNTIFSFLLHALNVELENIRKFGFLKRPKFTDSTGVIKGKVIINKTLQNWAKGQLTDIASKHFELQKDTPENRVIKFTLEQILTGGVDDNKFVEVLPKELKDSLIQKYKWFQGIHLGNIQNDIKEVENIIQHKKISKSREYYYSILNICLVILSFMEFEFESQKRVKTRGFSVNMNTVFEKYVDSILKDIIEPPYIVVDNNEFKSQDKYKVFRKLFADSQQREDKRNSKYTIKPDYIIFYKENSSLQPKLVLDAKYEENPTSDDLYQIITYALRLGVREAMLILPSFDEENHIETQVFTSPLHEGLKINIKILRLSLLSSKRFEETLKNEIHKVLSE
ncbi:hypothetical protein [Thermococcus sp. 21S9]|uniref:5-methylcytosine restriction system specificity protein McrC n=2 Tax=unclassified Thermococcus TaxID=2627626 RepID=UPI00143A192F|nr:hypothetical protein [Thermococcus sp. 21S9]NJE54663.1 hypothetical protein [Thermococcus sp. 21S9]